MEDVKDIVVLLFLLLFDAQTTESKGSPNKLNLDFVSFAVEPLTLYGQENSLGLNRFPSLDMVSYIHETEREVQSQQTQEVCFS